MKRRIAFSGASGTGKTTLAEATAVRLGLPVNPVGSRSVAEAMGFSSPYDVDAAGMRAEFQRMLLVEKVAWEAEREEFVTDRTTLDVLAYTVLHDVRSIDEEFLATVLRGFSRYTHVVCCPISSFWRVDNDPSRVLDATYHRLYEATLGGLGSLVDVDEQIGVLELKASDLGERIEKVLSFVNGGVDVISPDKMSEILHSWNP